MTNFLQRLPVLILFFLLYSISVSAQTLVSASSPGSFAGIDNGATLPSVSPRLVPTIANKLLPFFVDGKLGADVWQTEIRIGNPSKLPLGVDLIFHFEQPPFQSVPALPIEGGGLVVNLSLSIPPKGLKVFRTNGSEFANLAIGWVEVQSSLPVSAQALFRRHAGDGNYYEGSVPLVTGPSTTFRVPFDGGMHSSGAVFSTGIAVANASNSVSAFIICTAYDSEGLILGKNLALPQLDAYGHSIVNLQSSWPVLGNKRGVIACTSSAPVGVVGLRFFGPFALSSIPAILGD